MDALQEYLKSEIEEVRKGTSDICVIQSLEANIANICASYVNWLIETKMIDVNLPEQDKFSIFKNREEL